jgi:hypothetical protein
MQNEETTLSDKSDVIVKVVQPGLIKKKRKADGSP